MIKSMAPPDWSTSQPEAEQDSYQWQLSDASAQWRKWLIDYPIHYTPKVFKFIYNAIWNIFWRWLKT